MKMKFFILLAFLPWGSVSANEYNLFDQEHAVQNGINVFDVSNGFTDIYKKLDTVSWGGQSVNIAIESVEKVNKNAHIAATDERIIFVWKDTIVANYPRPQAGDWDGFGQITTALIVKLRELDPEFGRMSENQMYQIVVDALMQGIDENGKYIYSKQSEILENGKILTSVGLEGDKDENGNFRIHAVYKDSPADISGIKEGDLISKINGKNISDMTNFDIENELSGFNSGTLKLFLLTPSGSKKVVLRRASIVLADADIIYKNINNQNNGGILEIVIHKITDNSVSIINEALAKYPDISGIVLDMRAASGADEKSAAKLAGLFIGQNPVMRIVETAKSESEIIPGGSAVTDVPVVVLISFSTNGTAEVVASAFYENNRAVLVGTPTSGRAKISTAIDLNNGGQLILFNKVIKTGKGADIEGRGVFPSVCLSNIRNDVQQGAFFVNVLNGDFKLQDFNQETKMPILNIRKGCPSITSGEDEDLLSAGVSVKILTDDKVYKKLLIK